MWFCIRILRIPWPERLSNEKLLKKMATKRKKIVLNQKEVDIISWIHNAEGWLGKFNNQKAYMAKIDSWRQGATHLTSLCEGISEPGAGVLAKEEPLLNFKTDKKLWRAMIDHLLNGDSTRG